MPILAGAVLSNWLIYEVLKEAGLPKNVIQFIPGKADRVVSEALKHPHLGALHFTGSTAVFRKLWKDIAQKIDTYHSYPRIVGETGGKNFHLIHSSAPIKSSVVSQESPCKKQSSFKVCRSKAYEQHSSIRGRNVVRFRAYMSRDLSGKAVSSSN